MKHRRLKGILLLVLVLMANWVIRSGSGATAWASGLTKVAAAPAVAANPDCL